MNEQTIRYILNFKEERLPTPNLGCIDPYFEKNSFSNWVCDEAVEWILDAPFVPAKESIVRLFVKLIECSAVADDPKIKDRYIEAWMTIEELLYYISEKERERKMQNE